MPFDSSAIPKLIGSAVVRIALTICLLLTPAALADTDQPTPENSTTQYADGELDAALDQALEAALRTTPFESLALYIPTDASDRLNVTLRNQAMQTRRLSVLSSDDGRDAIAELTAQRLDDGRIEVLITHARTGMLIGAGVAGEAISTLGTNEPAPGFDPGPALFNLLTLAVSTAVFWFAVGLPAKRHLARATRPRVIYLEPIGFDTANPFEDTRRFGDAQ